MINKDKMIKSMALHSELMLKIYKCIMRPVATCRYEIWTMTSKNGIMKSKALIMI